jgi:hypothetical protein
MSQSGPYLVVPVLLFLTQPERALGATGSEDERCIGMKERSP